MSKRIGMVVAWIAVSFGAVVYVAALMAQNNRMAAVALFVSIWTAAVLFLIKRRG